MAQGVKWLNRGRLVVTCVTDVQNDRMETDVRSWTSNMRSVGRQDWLWRHWPGTVPIVVRWRISSELLHDSCSIAAIMASSLASVCTVLKRSVFTRALGVTSVISGFRRDTDEIWALLGYYAASNGNPVPAFRDNVSLPNSRVKKMWRIRCPETSVRDYDSTLRNTPDERRS
jgi:hypothetical protein